jgi:hypothetical protein
MAAHTYSFGVGGQDVYIVKTDATGNLLWYKTYGGTYNDVGYSIRQTSDGGYIVAGATRSFGAGLNDFYLLRLDAGGDSIWTKTYGGGSGEGARCVRQLPDGGYIVVGNTSSFAVGGKDVWLVRTDSLGVVIWTERYGGSWEDRGYSVDLTADGGFIITGTTQLLSDAENDLFLIRTDSTGYALWTRAYGGPMAELGNSIKYLSDGGCIAAGWTESYGGGLQDLYLLRTDASGDTIWTQTYGGLDADAGFSVEVIPDGTYAVTGWTVTYGPGDYDIWLLRTAGDVASIDEFTATRGAEFTVDVWPNPAPGYAKLTYRPKSPSRVDIAIYDIVGCKVREVISPKSSEGMQRHIWDGKDSRGQEVPPGIYFIRIQAGDQVATRKIVLVR